MSQVRLVVKCHWHGLGHVNKGREVAEEEPGWNWLEYEERNMLQWRQRMQAHLSLLWSNTSLWNADVSGRSSFPDPDATRDQSQTLGKRVSAAARPGPELTSSLALCVFDPVTHVSVAHFFPPKLEIREIPI